MPHTALDQSPILSAGQVPAIVSKQGLNLLLAYVSCEGPLQTSHSVKSLDVYMHWTSRAKKENQPLKSLQEEVA